jgi:hypothetical protein
MSFGPSKLYFLTLFFFCGSQFSIAQDRSLGTWKSFMPYGSCVTVCDAGDKIYCAASKSLFSYEKETGVIQTYDKANGLNDIGIRTMNYDPATNILVIAYLNSNIDLLYNGTDVYNISDIKDKSTTGAIPINEISFYSGSTYISTDIGISIINLAKKEISNSYIIGSGGSQVKVYSTSTDGITIYAATQEGLKYAPFSSPNLQNFNSWITINSLSGLPVIPFTHVCAFNNKVYAVSRGASLTPDTLYVSSGTQWQSIYFEGNDSVTSLQATNNTLHFTIWDDTSGHLSGKQGKIDASGNLSVNACVGHIRPVAWFDNNNTSWEADAWGSLIKNTDGTVARIAPDGPFTSAVFDIETEGNTIKIAPGGADDSWGYAWNFDGFFMYQHGKWTVRNQYSDPALANYSDILAVATVNSSQKTYFGSFLSGLIEYNNQSGALTFYDRTNSLLEEPAGDPGRSKISALCVDKDNNLWIGNAGANKPIKLIKPDGTWKEFGVPFYFDLMKKIIVDQNGQLWAPLRGSANTGILVWSNNGTLDDPADDKSRVLKSGEGNGGLPDAVVHSLVEDLDGNIWVGTEKGIAVYYCPGSVLSGGCDADQIKVERDGYIGYLFGTEIVRALAVDAANRKWVGTSNGLWLISSDGKTELLKFTTDNSPLPNNQITDIAINKTTGEVFIGTIEGMVSYQSDAIAECSDCNGALVYPNPVKPDYQGPIAIKGLVDQAYVKITDVAGTLVFQGKANGTQMIWDGKGYNGQRAHSGVYLVFSSTDLGKEKRVGKILIMN